MSQERKEPLFSIYEVEVGSEQIARLKQYCEESIVAGQAIEDSINQRKFKSEVNIRMHHLKSQLWKSRLRFEAIASDL